MLHIVESLSVIIYILDLGSQNVFGKVKFPKKALKWIFARLKPCFSYSSIYITGFVSLCWKNKKKSQYLSKCK